MVKTKASAFHTQVRKVFLDSCPVCAYTEIKRCEETKTQMHPDEEVFYFDECQRCKLVFLNPRVATACLHRYYDQHYLPYRGAGAWGKYAGFVTKSQEKLDRDRAKLMGRFQQLNEESLILDIGCGRPTFLKACQTMYGCQAMGIDFSAHGWKNDDHEFGGLNLQVAEVKDLSDSTNPDVITMWHYLEHDYDPISTLKKLRKLAKPTTRLLIEVPNYDSESRKKYGPYWAGYHTPRHTFLFSPNNLKLLLQKTGWQAKHIDTNGTLDPYNLYWMSKMEIRGIDWQKDMTPEFWPYVFGMFGFKVKNLFKNNKSLGIMVVTATIQ